MNKNLMICLALAICVCGLGACNTIDGFGKDLQGAGKAIDDAIE